MVIKTDLGPVLHKQLQCVYKAFLSSHVQRSQPPANDEADAIQVYRVDQDIKVTYMCKCIQLHYVCTCTYTYRFSNNQ